MSKSAPAYAVPELSVEHPTSVLWLKVRGQRLVKLTVAFVCAEIIANVERLTDEDTNRILRMGERVWAEKKRRLNHDNISAG